MLKKLFLIIIMFLTSIIFVNGANVSIDVNVYNESTEYRYIVNFAKGENYDSFAFEKPKESKIITVVDFEKNNIKYNIAGDYYIILPDGTNNRSFEIIFKTPSVSKNIISKNSYSNYINFNINIEYLKYTLKFENEFGNYDEIFPRDYIELDTGEIVWELNNLEPDTLFLVNFENKKPEENNDNQDEMNQFMKDASVYFWIGLMLGLFILIIVIIYLATYFNKNKKEEKENKEDKNNPVDKEKTENHQEEDKNSKEKENKKEVKTDDNINKESYKEILEKYLTDNEKEVVEVVKDNEGISQYDILNFLPKLTKSNLSKIISKLNSRKILKRIKVGKVNKIYLGERLENKKEISKEKE